MIHADTDGDRVWLTADWRYKEMIKALPGSRWKDGVGWSVPLSWATCRQLQYMFGRQLTCGPELVEWATRELNERVQPCLDLRMATDAPGDELLYPFQRAGVRFLTLARQALLCDEMGTGKTVQVAVALRELERERNQAIFHGQEDLAPPSPFPCLVICPKSVKRQWVRELEKWVPGVVAVAPESGIKNMRDATASEPDVLVINYENTWRYSRVAGYGSIKLSDADKKEGPLNEVDWATVVVDEAHKIKGPTTKQTRACWWLGHRPSVAYRYCLTGTPISKAPDDLWSALHFLVPREFSSRVEYVDRYCLTVYSPYGGDEVIGIRPEMQHEFFEIVDWRMRRMPKDLVLPFLPPKRRVTRSTPMDAKQRKAYDQMEREMMAELEGGEYVAALSPMVQRLRKMQFASAFAQLDDDGHVRLSEPSCKVDELMDVLEELGDEQVVVFAQSRQLVEIASARLDAAHVSHALIVGGQDSQQRDDIIAGFRSGRFRVVLCTSAGGTGLDGLQVANHCVFMQRFDSLVDNLQAEDRLHRIGSEAHDSVNYVDLVTPGTVEEKQVDDLHAKFARLQEIVRDRATLYHAATQGNQDAVEKIRELDAAYAAMFEGVA